MAIQLNGNTQQRSSGTPTPGRMLIFIGALAMFGTLAYYKFFATHERPVAAEAAYPLVNQRRQPITPPEEIIPVVKTQPPKPEPPRPNVQPKPAQKPEKSEWQKMIEKKRIEAAWAGPLVGSAGKQTASNHTNGNGNGNGNSHGYPNQNGNPQVLEIPSQQVRNGNGTPWEGASNGQGNVWNTRFDQRGQGQPGVLQRYATPYVIQRGWTIPARMVSPINTDSPGQVTAVVLQDVMDSPTGRYTLIPEGATLVGAYNPQTRYGVDKVAVAWDQINFPNGTFMPIPAMPGADQTGVAGIPGEVNNHLLSTAFRAALLTITGAASRMATQGAYDGGDYDPSDALAAEGGMELRRNSRRAFGMGINRPPTVTTEAGQEILVQVTRPLVFQEPYQEIIDVAFTE